MQRGTVGGALRLILVGGGVFCVIGGEGVLQGRALGRGGDLPETGEGGDACGAHLGEGDVLAAVKPTIGEHAIEEAAFERDGLLGRGQLPQRGQAVAQLTVGARRGLRHRIHGVQRVDGAGVEGEGRGLVFGAPVGSGADAGQALQAPLDDILDRTVAAHPAQCRVNALAGSGERCAELLLAAQQAVGQTAFPLQLVHQCLDTQTEADLGTGRPGITESLGAAVHGETGHRQQQADRDRDDHRHPAPDTAPARHRPAAGSRSVTAAAP